MDQCPTQILHQSTHEDEALHASNHQPMVVIQREYDIKERKLLKKEQQSASISILSMNLNDELDKMGKYKYINVNIKYVIDLLVVVFKYFTLFHLLLINKMLRTK
eukprot:258187_1